VDAVKRWVDLLPAAPALYLATLFVGCVVTRLTYPFDLEWMEGGMLAHAWRLERGLPLYGPPSPQWIPYVYPPGFSAVLAALPGPVDYPLGRGISWVGTLAACAAMVRLAWRRGRSWALGLVFAGLYLGTFRASGGFLDLVRPDALAMGLGAWAMALALDGRRGTEVAGGLLLAAAYLVKHNLAGFGVPLALGLWAWRGWRVAWRFGLAAAGPALLLTAVLQWRSGGGFLTYLVQVPRSHDFTDIRALPGTQGELGHWLGPALIASGLMLAAAAPRRFEAVHPAVAWAGAGLGGTLIASWAVLQPDVPGNATPHISVMAATFFSLGAALCAAAVAGLTAMMERRVDGPWWCAFGVWFTAITLGSVMRAHQGGFLNVLMPVHWVILATCAVTLGLVRHHHGHVLTWLGTALVAAAQGVWLGAMTDFEQVTPTDEDRKKGERVVQVVSRRCDGPIWSPHAAWLPVQAGQAPSLPLIALWDVDHRDGPLHDEVAEVESAIAAAHFACVVSFGRHPPGYGVSDTYRQVHTFRFRGRALRPKTGWKVYARSLWVPK